MAAGILGVILQPYSAERLTMAVIIMAVLATLLAIIATVRQEPRTAVLQEAGEAARAVSFKKVVKELVWDDPQARLFFTIVMLTLMGTQMQDVLLEPYGALVFGIADGILGTFNMESGWGLFGVIWTLVILVPGLAVTIRRLHDIGRAGWWILVVLIPLIGVIVLLIFMVLDSNAEENEYGPNPKAASA